MMKHFCIAVLFNLLLFLSTAALAQVQVGLKAGTNLSNTVTINVPESLGDFVQSDYKLSYQAGGFVTLPLREKINVQLELLYANKGDRSDALENKTNLHYLTLPVLLQYEVVNKLKIEIGPEVSYLLAAYSRNLSGQTSRKLNSIKDFDIGIDAGIAYDLTEKLLLGLRYNAGLSSIIGTVNFTDINGNIVANNIKVQNRSLQLSVGYRLF